MGKSFLPNEVIKKTTVKRVVWTLVLTIVFFGALNYTAFSYLETYTTNKGYFLVKKKWDILRNMKKRAKWLIVGDSAGNQGVLTSTVEGSLGAPAFNLCTVGDNAALVDAWMIDYHIKKNGPPENILMVHVYDVWKRKPIEGVIGRSPLLSVFANGLKPMPFSGDKKYDLFFSKYFALYHQNLSLRKILKEAEFSLEERWAVEPHGYQRHNHPYPKTVEKDLGWHLASLKKETFKISDTNQQALDFIKQLVDKHQINLYIAHSPVADILYEKPEYQKYFHDVDSALQSYAASSSNIQIINSDQIQFTADEMQNTDHVIHPAAEKYTLHLIEEIQKKQ